MKKFLGFAVAVAFLALSAPMIAWAGDIQLGIIMVTDAGTTNNANTGYGWAFCGTEPSCAQAFPIVANDLVTLQAITACVVAVDRVTNDAGIGLELAAGEKITSSMGGNIRSYTKADGGTYSGAIISVAPAPGSATCSLKVSKRKGNE